MITTLKAIKEHDFCPNGWRKLLRHLGKTEADDEPLSIVTILDSNGIDDALWCLRAVKGRDREIRLYAVWCARQVQHLMKDPRSVAALDVAERYAHGVATDAELWAARAAARAAAWGAEGAVARDAAWDAAARAAAWAAVGDAAWAARTAAWTARDAAWAAGAAWEAARQQQADKLREICLEAENG